MITVGEEKIAWQEGMTVAQVMETVADGHKYAVVKLNGKPVSRPHFKITPVPDHANIILIPMIAGG